MTLIWFHKSDLPVTCDHCSQVEGMVHHKQTLQILISWYRNRYDKQSCVSFCSQISLIKKNIGVCWNCWMGHIGKLNGNGMSDSRPSLDVEALDLDWKLIRLHLCLVGLVGHKGRFSVTPAHSSSHPKTSSFPDAGLCQQCHAHSCICIYICICVFSTVFVFFHFAFASVAGRAWSGYFLTAALLSTTRIVIIIIKWMVWIWVKIRGP